VITEDPDERLITVKVDPSFAETLVRQHESVHPGRYFDKRHWVSVGPGPGITTKLVESLVHDSYDNVVDRLSRQDQNRIDRDLGGR
jgi:predicted DNA-binding protein (MmcQ/YjbR family)